MLDEREASLGKGVRCRGKVMSFPLRIDVG